MNETDDAATVFAEEYTETRRTLLEAAEGLFELGKEVGTDLERAVLKDIRSWIESAADSAALPGKQAEIWFPEGLQLLAEADRRRFMLENLLESTKRGEDPRVALRRFQKLGLMKNEVAVAEPPTKETLEEVAKFQSAGARVALNAHRWLCRASTVVAGLTVLAAKAIPDLAKVAVGFRLKGGMPTMTFDFDGVGSLSVKNALKHITNVAHVSAP